MNAAAKPKLSPEDAATVKALKEVRDADLARTAARISKLTDEEKRRMREEADMNAVALADFKRGGLLVNTADQMIRDLELNNEGVPEWFADISGQWDYALDLLGEDLRLETMTEAWRTGLRHAGVITENAKVWNGGKYPRKLPFVIEFTCPLDHLTSDAYDRARVRMVIRKGGWWSYDPASPCPECTPESLRSWLLACERCEADEDSERHPHDHEAFDEHDMSPVAWVLREFERLMRVAKARGWVERFHEAAADLGEHGNGYLRSKDGTVIRVADWQLARARATFGAVPKAAISAKDDAKPKITPADAATWLDAQEVPSTLGQTATWNLVKDIAGCPPQSVVYAAVKLRKGRATEP